MVKLYNNSKLPDAALRAVLSDALRFSGAKGDVVTIVGRGRTVKGWGGYATRCSTWARVRGRVVNTNGGFVHIATKLSGDPLRCAETFFDIAIHEFAHVKDYQLDPFRTNLTWQKNAGSRKHSALPQEVRADNAVWEAHETLKRDKARRARVEENILALAIAMEATR